MQRLPWHRSSGARTRGEVVDVGRNTMHSANGRNSWMIEYTFEVGGQVYGGAVSSFDASLSRVEVGHALNVVYLHEDPSSSSTWPPISL